MGQNSGRARTFESAIGIIYLFHLVAIVVVLLVVQSRFDMARFGPASLRYAAASPGSSNDYGVASPVSPNGYALASVSQAAAEEEKYAGGTDSNSIMFGFSYNAATDFTPTGKAETYDTDNLYEKIDGKAPMYQETGFVKLTTQRLKLAKNPDLSMEMYIYDMGNAKNAFSVYSRQKRDDVVDLNDADWWLGYKTTNSVYVFDDSRYIEMIGFAESPELVDSMVHFVRILMDQVTEPEKNNKLPELNYFPPGIIPGSVQLQIIDAYGFDGLTDTWSAKFKVNDKAVTIFFSKRSNEGEAKKVAKSYYDFLMSNGAKAVNSETSMLDFMGSTEIVFAAGSFVGGVHEADDRDAALKAADALSKRLNEISEKTGG